LSLWNLQADRVFSTDKHRPYLEIYEHVLAKWRDQPIAILEVGVATGGSLSLWAEYFPHARVFGLDLVLPDCGFSPNVKLHRGDQSNLHDWAAAMEAWNCTEFDVIIDDASHFGNFSATTFALLFHRHLKPGGHYFIEDWGTGYWSDWPDGEAPRDYGRVLATHASATPGPPYDRANRGHVIPSHQAGMVGFLKLLIDVLAVGDISNKYPEQAVPRERIAGIDIRLGVAVVHKAEAPASV
jgi:SAM-dependent methyltransferase